jgi:hypothetical protein
VILVTLNDGTQLKVAAQFSPPSGGHTDWFAREKLKSLLQQSEQVTRVLEVPEE